MALPGEVDGRPAAELGGVEIPTIRCTIPLREQAGLAADPQVMRTVSRHVGRLAERVRRGTIRAGNKMMPR